LWEAVRYILLAALFTLYFNRELSGESALFFLWITSYLFVMLAALLLAALRPRRFGLFVPLAGAGKLFQFVSGLLLYLFEQKVFLFVRSLFGSPGPGSGMTELSSSLTLISAVVGIDLLMALFLLVYKPVHPDEGTSNADELPRAEITEVEDS
jgi:hypothetical protein